MKMDVERIFHMKGGHGETSYSRNSSLQKNASDMVKHITMEAIQEVFLSKTPPKSLAIADLGCSSGPNSLSFIRDLYHTVEEAYQKILINGGPDYSPPPQLSVYLNDLPSNDFNSVFTALPDLYREIFRGRSDGNLSHLHGHTRPSLFVAASPGSFYGRLFHPNFLHFVYSSYSLHWLSKAPPGIYDEDGNSMNKGSIYICEESPPIVSLSYQHQFQEDFSNFLSLRSQELVSGGRMVLVFLGRDGPTHIDRGNSFLWQLLARSFSILISQGRVEEEKLDSYDVHFYAPNKEEIEEGVSKEGSFKMDCLDTLVIKREDENSGSYGVAVARTVRAIQESMISHHFGEHILDSLFDTYAHVVDQEMSKQEIRPLTFLLVLTKL